MRLENNTLLKGEICEQYIVCSKPRCRCTGGQLHGPYYYRVWREGERIKKEYVAKDNLEAARAACMAYKQAKDVLRTRNAQREELTRSLRKTFRKTMRSTLTSAVTASGTLFTEAGVQMTFMD